MRRGAYLVAKWLSHLAVFLIVLAVGLGVGLVAQCVRAEDLRIDLVELAKPVLVLTLPSLALTAALAVWFDLVPWLRRSAGNVLFFVLWIALLGVGVSQAEQAPGAALPWPGDPHGLLVAEYDLSRAWPTIDGGKELGLSVGTQALEGKSSLGRLGLLIHSTAGYVDPGWKGNLTLELSNVANLPIALYYGMKIGQISFFRMSSAVERPYGSPQLGSKYQGQSEPTASAFHRNFSNGKDAPEPADSDEPASLLRSE